MAALLGRLSTAEWASLGQQGDLVFSTRPRPGELSLPAPTARLFSAAQPGQMPLELHAQPVPADIAGSMRDFDERARAGWGAAAGYRVRIRLVADQARHRPIALMAVAEPIEAAGKAGPPAASLFIEALPASLGKRMDDAHRQGDAASTDPVLGVKKDVRAVLGAGPGAGGSTTRAALHLRDLLPALARVFDVEFISDAYWYPPALLPQFFAGEPQRPRSLADFLAYAGSWDRHGSLIRIRNPEWFSARPREVPLRLVRRWQGMFSDGAALPLEEYVRTVRALTEEQIDGLGDVARWGALPRDVLDVDECRYALALYAALAPAQRQALLEGRALPVAAMPSAARAYFEGGLRAWYRTHWSANAEPEEGELRFAVSATPGMRAVHARGAIPVVNMQFHFQFAEGGQETVFLTVSAPQASGLGASRRRAARRASGTGISRR